MRSASGGVTEQPPKMSRFHDISSHLLKAQDAMELDHRNRRFCGEFGSREFRGRDSKGYRRKNWSVTLWWALRGGARMHTILQRRRSKCQCRWSFHVEEC